ncbi:unnamed protein product, partial [Mesorhabditis spiculigera]
MAPNSLYFGLLCVFTTTLATSTCPDLATMCANNKNVCTSAKFGGFMKYAQLIFRALLGSYRGCADDATADCSNTANCTSSDQETRFEMVVKCPKTCGFCQNGVMMAKILNKKKRSGGNN